ncbi:MAG: 1,4-alpha-glucan-branching enzyme, partial [Muribaculaceae bacterium]
MAEKSKTPAKKRSASTRKPKVLPILKNDPWLEPFADAINGRHNDVINVEQRLTQESGSLSEFANAHRYFGLHKYDDGQWVFREWAPNATAITLIGDFSNWEKR